MNDVGSARPRRARAGRRNAVSGRGERDRPSESPKRQLGPGDDRSSGGGTAGQGGHRLRAHRPRRRSSRVPAWWRRAATCTTWWRSTASWISTRLSLRRGAEALISIAHPDVRDELRRETNALRHWTLW